MCKEARNAMTIVLQYGYMTPTSKYDWGRKSAPIKDRIKKSISIDDNGCWVWKYKPFCKAGYVRAVVGSRRDGTRKKVLAHRLSYETFIGKIPKGMTIDHLCNNTSCVNPEHLEAVTLWENISRSKTSPTAVNARKTNCPKCNSEYTNKKTGGRYCKPCYIEYHKEYNKNRAACARKLGML